MRGPLPSYGSLLSPSSSNTGGSMRCGGTYASTRLVSISVFVMATVAYGHGILRERGCFKSCFFIAQVYRSFMLHCCGPSIQDQSPCHQSTWSSLVIPQRSYDTISSPIVFPTFPRVSLIQLHTPPAQLPSQIPHPPLPLTYPTLPVETVFHPTTGPYASSRHPPHSS